MNQEVIPAEATKAAETADAAEAASTTRVQQDYQQQ